METKICNKCGEEKELSEFYKHKAGRYGVVAVCKNCKSLYRRNYSKSNREKIKSYRDANRDKIRAYDRAFRNKNPEKRKMYYLKNKDKFKQLRKAYREKNRDKLIEYSRKYRENNADHLLCYNLNLIVNMEDPYMARLIHKQFKINLKEIYQNPELIQLKRLEIALKRKRKEITKK